MTLDRMESLAVLKLRSYNPSSVLAAALALSFTAFGTSLPASAGDPIAQTVPQINFKRKAKTFKSQTYGPIEVTTDSAYCKRVMRTIDKIVRSDFYNAETAEKVWPKALASCRAQILNSKTLMELNKSINKAIHELKSSHCEFVTANDERFHFLHTLFATFNPKMKTAPIEFTGFVTGDCGFDENQVRYVMDASPASRAGIRIGDKILTVNGKPYEGLCNFAGHGRRALTLVIDRGGQKLQRSLAVELRDYYKEGYVKATTASAQIWPLEDGKYKVGYVHYWSGGKQSHEALDDLLNDKFQSTDGLILDLRDGYGGASLDDLERFYKTELAYPIFRTKTRKSKDWEIDKEFYDKPLVCLINKGSRSGKELLAFSLKRTKRATLVGENTAGAVVAGRLWPIDKRCSLYLAVADGDIGGVRLEGVGVAPDVEIINTDKTQTGYDKQLEKAQGVLVELIEKEKQKKE